MPQPEAGKLTPKQRVFCEEYITNGFNALAAYRKAFPKASANKKPSYPYTLLNTPHIKAYIEQRRSEIFESLQIDQKRVMSEIAEIAFAEKGDEIYTTANKVKALELLCKVLGLQVSKTENKDTIEVSLLQEDEDNG